MRDDQRSTLPSTIARERAADAFLRAADPTLAESASRRTGQTLRNRAQVFTALRDWKNRF